MAYPPYWEMGRGEELLELCGTASGVWHFFDHDLMKKTFESLLDREQYAALPHRKTSAINTAAQKLIWLMTLEQNLDEINRLCTTIRQEHD